VNPKAVNKKAQKQIEETLPVEEEPVEEEPVEEVSVEERPAMRPLDEVLGQAQKAYAAYMDATREVSRIYRENEIQVAEAYRRAEQQANEACEENIKQALKDREGAESRAQDAYREAMAEAERESSESVMRFSAEPGRYAKKLFPRHGKYIRRSSGSRKSGIKGTFPIAAGKSDYRREGMSFREPSRAVWSITPS
jgi:hypothetical protein